MTKRFFLLSGLISLLAGASYSQEVLDRIVAVVGKEVISLRELETSYQADSLRFLSLFPDEIFPAGKNLSKREYLERMVEQKLLEQEISRQGVTVSALELEKAIERQRLKLGLNEADFKKAINSQGLTYEEYREKVRKSLTTVKLVSQELRSEIEVSEREIESYYNQHRDEFISKGRVHLFHITILKESGKKDLIVELEKRLKAREDFIGLARQYSQTPDREKGGDLGWLEIDMLEPGLREIVEKLNVNEISPIYENEQGWHLFWLCGKEAGTQKGLEELRDEIQEIIYRQKLSQRYEQWLKRLKARTYVEIRFNED